MVLEFGGVEYLKNSNSLKAILWVDTLYEK